jgi:glutaminyl-peptide cyclotransferase
MRAATIGLALGSGLLLLGCGGSAAPPPPEPPEPAASQDFEGERAFADLRGMVERGHRYYGAPERDAALQAIVERFRDHVAEVRRQRFEVDHPDGAGQITLENVLLRQHPGRHRRLILGSHWDTRLWAEEDPNEDRVEEPIPGANDGTSGIAVMLEIARALAARPLEGFGVDYVLFDGEEYGQPGNDLYCQGSRYLVAHLDEWYPGGTLPEGAIVMDMVADADLGIPRETFSLRRARWLVELVWDAARDRGEDAFIDDRQISIIDDQLPLLEAGIPAILLIDYDYPWWHTHEDTLERCSAESLRRVGNVVLDALRRIDARR